MFPVLFEIPLPWGDAGTVFPIRMFGILVILGFLAGTWVTSRRLAGRGILTGQETFDFCFYLLAVGVAGSRLCHVLQNIEQFHGRFLRIFAIWEGGLVWYGGFAAATAFAFWWLWKRKLPVLEVTDALALGLALGLAIGRIGCFCAGDDYGRHITAPDGSVIVTEELAPWYAVQFPNPEDGWRYRYTEAPAEYRAPAWVHPVQIYMVLGNLAVFGALWLVSRRATKLGVLSACYFLFYSVARFVVEFWRGDADRGVFGPEDGLQLSFSQLFGIPVFVVGLLLLRSALRRSGGARPASG